MITVRFAAIDRLARRIPKTGLLLAMLAVTSSMPVFGQSGLGPVRDPSWSDPVQIFAAPEGIEKVYRAVLAADGYGQLHVVVETEDPTGSHIYFYSRWDGLSWTQSIDIAVLRSPIADLEWDGANEMYLFLDNGLWLSADVAADPSSQEWALHDLEPYGPRDAIAPDAMVVGGRLHVCYAIVGSQVACAARELDGVWNEATNISAAAPGRLTNWPRVASGPNGRLHAVWTELVSPSGWPPVGVFHAVADESVLRWSEPFELGAGSYDQANVAVDEDGVVHVTWLGAAGGGDQAGANGRYHRFSFDDGLTWSEQVTITPRGATEGWPEMAFDASRGLHLITSLSSEPSYMRYANGGWTEPSYIALDPAVEVEGEVPSNREYPQMVTSQGRLHVLFRDTGGWWYTSRVIGDVNEAALPLPAPDQRRPLETASRPKAEDGESPALIIEADAAEAVDMSQLMEVADPSTANYGLLLGLLPAALIVGLVLWRRDKTRQVNRDRHDASRS